MKKIVLCILFLMLWPAHVLYAVNDVDEIIIFVDQSSSMYNYDPGKISKKWLMNFINTFDKDYKVTLLGFDDRVHDYGHVIVKTKKDLEILSEKIGLTESYGLTTNLEVPFQYLSILDDAESIKTVIIVSDWEPEIWDEKRLYLSKRIRRDWRYEDLIRQYRFMTSQEEDPEETYHKLHAPFKARNLAIIENCLISIKARLGGKLVLLDVYGKLAYGKKWAGILGSDYISIAPQSGLPVEAVLRNASMVIKKKLSGIVQVSQPGDHGQRPVIASAPDSRPILPVGEVAAQGSTKPESKKTGTGAVSGMWRVILLILFILGLGLLAAWFYRAVLLPSAVAKKTEKSLSALKKLNNEVREKQTMLERLAEGIKEKESEREKLDLELKEHRASELSRIETGITAEKADMEAGLQERQKQPEEDLGQELAEKKRVEYEKLENELNEHRASGQSRIEAEISAKKADMEAELEGWRSGEMDALRELNNGIREKKAMLEQLDAEAREKKSLQQTEEDMRRELEQRRFAEMEKLDNEISQRREMLLKEGEDEAANR